MTDDDDRVYPNPGSQKSWSDSEGRTWERRGDGVPDDKRVRRLLRSDDVALVTWSAGRMEWFEDVTAKEAAAERLRTTAEHAEDISPSEWRGTDGTKLLLLEHSC